MSQIDPRLEGKTFVCGVGVQKAGTTWLYDYLADRGDIYMSKPKEIHYFDTMHAPGRRSEHPVWLRDSVIGRLQEATPEDSPRKIRKLLSLLDIYRMYLDEDGYTDFFGRRSNEYAMFGEITPAYCMIGTEGFAHMRRLFQKVKIVYLMRDPVERHYSAARMSVGRNESGLSAEEYFMRKLDSPFGLSMTDYGSHIEALRQIFTPDEIFIGYYETLFNDAEIQRLCDFLGVPFMTGDYAFRANKSDEGGGLTPAMVKAAREAFDGTYSYCRNTLPDVPKSWRFDI